MPARSISSPLRSQRAPGRFRARSTRRIALAVAAVGAVVLTACSGGSSASGSGGSGKVTLNYMLWDPGQEVGYKQAVAEFEQAHPNIHVNVIQVGWTNYWTKLSTELAGGTAPDLFWMNLSEFPTFVKEGALTNMTPWISKLHINLKSYYSNLLQLFKYQGQYYSLPKDWDTIALCYNKNMVKKAHMPPPTNLSWNPTDGGTLLRYAEALTLSSNGKHAGEAGFDPSHITQYGLSVDLDGNGSQDGYANFLAQDGVPYITNGKAQFDTPQGVTVFNFLKNLIYKWHVAPPASETTLPTFAETTSAFLPQKVAMSYCGDYDLYTLATAKFPWGIAPLPSGPDGAATVANSLGVMVNSHTAHPQQAALLWAWLINHQSESILSHDGYIWGSMPSVDPLFVKYWQRKGVDVTPYLDGIHGKTINLGFITNANAVITAEANEINLLFLNRAPVDEALRTTVENMNRLASQGGQ